MSLGVSLQTGWLPWTVIVLGLAGGTYLLCRRDRWWWLYLVPGVAAVSAVIAWILGRTVAESLIAQALTTSDIVWIAVGIAAVGLAIGFMFGTPWWRKILAVIAALAVLALAGNEINKSYSEFPRFGDLFGVSGDDQISGPPSIASSVPATSAAPKPTGPLSTVWTPTGPNIPADGHGRISQLDLPATQAGFEPRQAWVYYPPAYFADNTEPLPVLILLHGVPGGPGDWVTGDRLQGVMNDFAAKHNGIAPVVVMPDGTGGQLTNSLCTDSSLGKLDTYLSKDVPNSIRAQLKVDPDPKHWAIGGFSYGGTCAIQLVTNHPDVYSSFIDVSGDQEPTLGSRQQTVDTAFGGDESKFKAINPIDIMASKKFPGIAGRFIVGGDDTGSLAGQQAIYQAAKNAGMDVQFLQVPGVGHDWSLAVSGLTTAMPWLAQRLNITA